MPYSPKIDIQLVNRLYKLKHSSPGKKTMTKMVNEAVAEYLLKYEEPVHPESALQEREGYEDSFDIKNH